MIKWWDRSLREGERLGAKIELSRAYYKVGKYLLETNSKYQELNDTTAENYFEKARNMFQEMDLQYDLDELEKFKLHMRT